MFESALYYPTIDIHNERWLKSAVLFWDRIETIVPESELRPYHRRCTRLLQEEGILFPRIVNPFCEEINGLEQDVIRFMDTPEGKKSFIKPWGVSAVSMALTKYPLPSSPPCGYIIYILFLRLFCLAIRTAPSLSTGTMPCLM